MQQQLQQSEGQKSFIPPFVRELVFFDKTQYQPATSSSSSSEENPDTLHPPLSTASTPLEYVSDDGLVILESMQTSLPASVVQSHNPTASQPEEFDPFRQSCVGVLSKLTRLLTLQQQSQSQDGSDSSDVAARAKATGALMDLYDVDGLGPWLGETGRRATEVWFHAFAKGEYDQAWLVGSTVLEQLIVNIIYTLQGPEKFIPFLVRDLLSVPCLTTSKSVDRTLIRVIKTLMGSPLTLNIRNLLWHGFVTPQDQIPLDAYGAMLIVTTMSIAVGVRRTMVEGLQIRYEGLHKEAKFYFRQAQEAEDKKEETGMGAFNAVFERVAYRDRRFPLLIAGYSEEGAFTGQDRDWDQVRAVLEAIVRTSSFVTPGTVHQWICALQHLQSANARIPTAVGSSSFMFVMASLPLLEHALRLIYVRVNGCKQDRTCALVAGEYYLTLDVILDEVVPPEYYDAEAEELMSYRADAIPNRLFLELGPQAMNLLQDLFLAALGPRLRDRTSHGENNTYFTTDIRTDQPWFDYYLGIVVFLLTMDSTSISKEYESVMTETRGWVRLYAERRFDEWSTLRKETVRALCTVLQYPQAAQNEGSSKEGGAEVVTGGDCPLLVAEVEEPGWITLRLKPRLSVVFTNENTFITEKGSNPLTLQDRIRICLSAWPTRPSSRSVQNQNPTNRNKNEEGKEIQGMASNLPAWILIVQSVQAAAEKVTTKMASFLELQRQRQLSSRSRKQLESMKPLVPGWLGMLVGCLALVEHFVLLAEEEDGGDDDDRVVVTSARKDESHEKAIGGVNDNGNSDNRNIGKKKNGKEGKGKEEKVVVGTVVDKSSAAEIRLRLAIVQFLNKFVSNFERVKLPMIEDAWLQLVKSADSVLSSKKVKA